MNKLVEIAQSLDTSGTRCPVPLLRAKQALKALQENDVLEVLATDPAAKPDFEAMLKHLPHELLLHEVLSTAPRKDRFLIRKA